MHVVLQILNDTLGLFWRSFISKTQKQKPKKKKKEAGEKKRIIVQDWEIEAETKDDFAEIDNWWKKMIDDTI